MNDPYSWPEWYDVLHAPGTVREAAALIRVARAFVGERAVRGSWLECGCGTARYGRALLSKGVARYVGVDLHPAMVAAARERVRAAGFGRMARIIDGDMRDLRNVRATGRSAFDVAFCLDNSVRHLLSDRAMVDHLRSVLEALRTGGVYIVGIGLRPEGGDAPSEHVAKAKGRGVTVHAVANYLPPEATARGRDARLEKCFVHTTVESKKNVQEQFARYALRTWTPEQWGRIVRASGMEEICVVDERARDLGASRTGYAYRVLRPRVRAHAR